MDEGVRKCGGVKNPSKTLGQESSASFSTAVLVGMQDVTFQGSCQVRFVVQASSTLPRKATHGILSKVYDV